MKVWLSFFCLFSLLACAMAVICNLGKKNYLRQSVVLFWCPDSCLRADYMMHSTMLGKSTYFRQSDFRCGSRSSCIDKVAACSKIINNIVSLSSFIRTTASDCIATCCSTNGCNLPEGEYTVSSNPSRTTVHYWLINPPTVQSTTQSTSSTSIAVTSNETPVIGRLSRCHKGTLSVHQQSFTTIPCTTACLTNEVNVTGKVEGRSVVFDMTTFACARSLDYCNSTLSCKTLENGISDLNIPSASDLNVKNCETKCCLSSDCNTRDLSRTYNMESGAERSASQWVGLCAISILTAFKLYFQS